MGQKPVEIKSILPSRRRLAGDLLATGDITIGGFFYHLFIRQFSGFNEFLLGDSRETETNHFKRLRNGTWLVLLPLRALVEQIFGRKRNDYLKKRSRKRKKTRKSEAGIYRFNESRYISALALRQISFLTPYWRYWPYCINTSSGTWWTSPLSVCLWKERKSEAD